MSDAESRAIARIQKASENSLSIYQQPLLVTYSGGKDSDVLLRLMERSGVPYEVCHSHTTADAPQTVYYVRDTFKRLESRGITCNVVHGKYKGIRTSMWSLIVTKKIPPTRLTRYCCSVLKENSGNNRFIVTGVRWAESFKRKNLSGIYEERDPHKSAYERIVLTNDNADDRDIVDACMSRKKIACNPIIDWSDEEVWDYLSESGIKGNPLYCMGMKRVGCVGCPLASHKKQEHEFMIFPQYRRLYVRTFTRMLIARRKAGLTEPSDSVPWRNGEDVMRWWLGYDHAQITFADLETMENTEEIEGWDST